MGRLIEQLAPEYGFTVAARYDVDRREPLDNIDVAVEFSAPGAVLSNVEMLAVRGIPVVIGTTGWLEHLDRLREIVEFHNSARSGVPTFRLA